MSLVFCLHYLYGGKAAPELADNGLCHSGHNLAGNYSFSGFESDMFVNDISISSTIQWMQFVYGLYNVVKICKDYGGACHFGIEDKEGRRFLLSF